MDDCHLDAGTFIEHGDRELAVFRLSDPHRVVVSDNTCPHAGGNLAGGEICGNTVVCPWHQWEFDLSTGECVHTLQARVRIYPSEIRDGSIWADLDRDTREVAAP